VLSKDVENQEAKEDKPAKVEDRSDIRDDSKHEEESQADV
jgi:hypothetical protein